MIARLTAQLNRFPRLTALIAGTLSATGFAPLGAWPVTLVALSILIHQITHTATVRRAFGLGWLFGLGHFTLGLHWIATAFTFQAAMPPILGWVAVPLLSAYLALYPALACASAWWLWKRTGTAQHYGAFTLLFASTWIITEWLRSWLFTGFAWNPLGAVLTPTDLPFLTVTIGTYGLAAVVITMAAALPWLGRQVAKLRWRNLRSAPTGNWVVTAFALLFVAPAVVAILVPSTVDRVFGAPVRATTATPVTIVQPNIEQGDKWDLSQRRENFIRLAALSRPTNSATPRLLLWPEAAVPDYLEPGYPLDWYIEDPATVRTRIAALLGPDDLLLTGAVRLEPNADRSDIDGARNSVFTLNARGELGPRYDKAHLVPYGEYLPMRSLLEPIGLTRLAPGAKDFWAGPGARSIDLGRFGTVGIQICYEIIFSGQVVDRTNRPDFIFNPSNDAWFGGWGPPQHLAQARLRAIEEGLPVVRATPTGISAIIDADGRIVDSIAQHRAGRIDAWLPPAHAPTLFARYGNILSLLFAVFLGALGVAIGRRAR